MPSDQLITFWPGKAGSGCSITALNVAACIAHSWHRKVLLVDADINSGLLSFLLKLSPRRSFVDVLQRSEDLTEIWHDAVTPTRVSLVDLLAAPPDRRHPASQTWHYQRFITYASSRYRTICADLPDVIDEAAKPLLAQAKWVCLVCTPEAASLALSMERIAFLQKLGVPPSRIAVVLNRCEEDCLSMDEIAAIVKHGVAGTLPKDDLAIRSSTMTGQPVERGSRLAKAFAQLSRTLVGSEPVVTDAGSRWRSWWPKQGVSKRRRQPEYSYSESDF